MRSFQTLLLLCLCCSPAYLQTTSESTQTSRTTADAQLQLTTEIVKAEYYCETGLKLDLELTFKNVGRVPIILSKRSLRVATFTVSRTLENAIDRQYEQQGRYESDFESTAILAPPVLSDFAVIQPGGTYRMKGSRTRVHLDLKSGFGGSVRGLSPGGYVLQVVVGTWLYFAVDEQSKIHLQDVEFREVWKQTGFLWSDSVTSQALQFTVDKNRINKCLKF